MEWKEAVIAALRRVSRRRGIRLITRRELITDEMAQIIKDTGARGEEDAGSRGRMMEFVERVFV